jgi:hypothetical protein
MEAVALGAEGQFSVMSKAKLDLGKFLSGGRAAQQAVDDAIAAHGRERGGAPRGAPEPRCSDCGARPIEAWSPYARYCYWCGSKGCCDVDAPWIEAIDGLEKELVLFAVHHRDIDLVPRALRWLQDQKGSSRS